MRTNKGLNYRPDSFRKMESTGEEILAINIDQQGLTAYDVEKRCAH